MFLLANDYLRHFETQGLQLGSHLLSGLLVFLVFVLIARTVRRLIEAAVARLSTEGHVDHIVAQLAYVAILVIGVVAALRAFGLNVTALVASLGLAGFAVGFAVKDILSNALAGVLILVQRPFTVGDEIALSGAEGRVVNVRVQVTLIKTAEGTLIYVPNSIIYNNIVNNKSSYGIRLITVRFKCAPDADPGGVIDICTSAFNDLTEILKSPRPQALLTELSEHGPDFQVKFWVDRRKSNCDAVRSTFLKSINAALLERDFRLVSETDVADTPDE